MAVKRNSLTDVGPATGQLKQTFSSSEISQINSLRGVSGTVSSSAGSITGDVSQALKNVNNTTQGRLAIGANMAASMEAAGITTNNITRFLSTSVSRSIASKTPIHKNPSQTTLDLSNPVNRYPSLRFQSPTEIINRKQKDVNGIQNNTFPNDLTTQSKAYVSLSFKKYSRTDAYSPGKLQGGKTINLPLPENYNQTFAMRYEQKDQGFFGDIASSDAGRSILSQLENGLNRETVQAASAALRGLATADAADLAASVAQRAGYQMLDAFSEISGGIAQQVAGAVPNPHSTIFFKGPDLRSFNWTWRLVPRSAEEAETIRDIIKQIKQAILPKRNDNFLAYPDLLQPSIETPNSNIDLGKFKKCLVKSLAINYSAEGASAFFKDGHPVAIQLAMEFQEVEIVTSEDV